MAKESTQDAQAPLAKTLASIVARRVGNMRQRCASKFVLLGRRLLYVDRNVVECDFAVWIGHRVHYVITTGRLGPRLIGHHLGRNREAGAIWHPVGLEFARPHSK